MISRKVAVALGAALLISWGAVGFLYWQVGAKTQQVGDLQARSDGLIQDVLDLEEETFRVRQEMELYRRLHERVEQRYEEIEQDRQLLRAELNELREERDDVQEYLRCPMPDSLYEWLLVN